MELILAKGLPARPASEGTVVTTPTVAGETDVEGQCGYLSEPTEADQERAAREAAETHEPK
jgi:hypothetical protein